MSPSELTIFITLVANVAAENSSSDEIALMAALFTQLGDTLATISLLKSDDEPETNVRQ